MGRNSKYCVCKPGPELQEMCDQTNHSAQEIFKLIFSCVQILMNTSNTQKSLQKKYDLQIFCWVHNSGKAFILNSSSLSIIIDSDKW